MRIRKKKTGSSEAVEVWGPRLRMPSEATYPVVQVINGNEQDIRFLRSHRNGTAAQNYQEKRQPGQEPGRIHVSRCIRGIPVRRAGLPPDRNHPLINTLS